jgi:hypothetical protein
MLGVRLPILRGISHMACVGMVNAHPDSCGDPDEDRRRHIIQPNVTVSLG